MGTTGQWFLIVSKSTLLKIEKIERIIFDMENLRRFSYQLCIITVAHLVALMSCVSHKLTWMVFDAFDLS